MGGRRIHPHYLESANVINSLVDSKNACYEQETLHNTLPASPHISLPATCMSEPFGIASGMLILSSQPLYLHECLMQPFLALLIIIFVSL